VNKLEVYINDELADIAPDDADLAITYSIADIQKLDDRKSRVTKTLKFPGTKRNRELFGFPDEPNVTGEVDQSTRPTCKVVYDGDTLLIGSFKITAVKRNYRDQVTVIEGVAFGDNGDWLSALQGDKLADLDFSSYNHDYTAANITLSEDTTGTAGTLADAVIVYPLINYGAMAETSVGVKIEERFPAVQIYEILRRIWGSVGYKIDSAFMDSAFFLGLYLPFTGDYLKRDIDAISEAFRVKITGYDEYDFGGGYIAGASSYFLHSQSSTSTFGGFTLPLDDETSSGMFDKGANYSPTLLDWNYTVPDDGYYNFAFAFKYNIAHITNGGASVASQSALFKIVKNGSTIIQSKTVDGSNYPDSLTSPTNAVSDLLESGSVYFDAGDTISITAQINPNNDPIDVSNELYIWKDGTYFYNQWLDKVAPGTTVDVAFNLPDVFQIDFIKAVKHLFNLYFITDPVTRTITIEPRDDMFNGEVIDWTEKLDRSRDIDIEYIGETINKNLVYGYLDDRSDAFVDNWENEQKEVLAQHRDSIDNRFSPDGDYGVVNNLFAPTIMDTYPEIGLTHTQIPKMWNKIQEFPDFAIPRLKTKFAPRILFYDGVYTLPFGQKWTFDSTIRTDMPRMYSVNEQDVNDNSLYFNTTRRSHGLFEKYYRNTHKILNESKIVSMYLHLTASDMSSLDFRKPIFIEIDGDGTYYELQAIHNYNPASKIPTRATLIKKVGVVQLTDLDTTADIYPPQTEAPKKQPPRVGLLTVSNGNIVPVYSLDGDGNYFWVQVG
jgi:hypothetical protein